MSRRPAQVEWIPASVAGRPGHRLMVVLAAPGCAWARRSGGCTNCGFAAALGTSRPVSAEDLVCQMREALRRIPDGEPAPVELDIFCSGSFFNPDEIPEEAQAELLRLGAAHRAVRSVLVETRPEYASAERLEAARAACDGKSLEIAIGLESASPALLRRIRKGFSFEDFERAAQRVAEARLSLVAYVLQKPIDTREGEALLDAAETIRKVFALSGRLGLPARVALEPCFVVPGTPLSRASEEGRYRPPWLWSVLAVVVQSHALGRIQVGLSDEGLGASHRPRNCERCSARVRAALVEFNATQRLTGLLELDCACREQWLAELSAEGLSEPLPANTESP